MFNRELVLNLTRIFAVVIAMISGAKVGFDLFGVPATMQTFFLCLTALYLSPTQVFLGQLAYLLLGLFLPVFSSELTGLEAFRDARAGYLFAFPFAAWLMAKNTQKGMDWFSVLSWCVVTHFIILMFGFVWLMLYKGFEPGRALNLGVMNYLPWAFIKSLLVTGIYLIAEMFFGRGKGANPESKA